MGAAIEGKQVDALAGYSRHTGPAAKARAPTTGFGESRAISGFSQQRRAHPAFAAGPVWRLYPGERVDRLPSIAAPMFSDCRPTTWTCFGSMP